jgi:ectoine hydroxylase-related dioxygenase (phytanoyl-CoA dioxygenase family)
MALKRFLCCCLGGGAARVMQRVQGQVLQHERRLRRDGYTVLQSVLAADDAADVKEALERAQESAGRVEMHGGAPQQVRVPDILLQHPVFAELLLHPAVTAVVQRLLHNDFRCATWSSNTLLPRMTTPALGWHVDYPYHDISPPWPRDTLSVQVLWLLDNFTQHNGATMFLPQSHSWLKPPDYDFSTPQQAQLLLAPAGSVLIAHGAWWHRQTPNLSPLPRSALLASLCRAFVVPKADMEGQFMGMKDNGLIEHLAAFQQERLQLLLLGQHMRGLRNVHA